MLSQHGKRAKFALIRQLIAEIDSDEQCMEHLESTSPAKQEATVIARCELGYGLEFIERAERRIRIRNGEIQP